MTTAGKWVRLELGSNRHTRLASQQRPTALLCARRCELLAHPLSQQRFAAIANALELLTVFPMAALPGGSFQARHTGAGGSPDPHRDCVAVLRLHEVMCILGPTLVAALLQQRSPWALEPAAATVRRHGGLDRAQLLGAAVQRRLELAHATLRAMGETLDPLQVLLAVWLLGTLVWTVVQGLPV